MSPTGSRKPLSPSVTTVAVPPARVATTGRSAASDSIATTGVPSFAEVRSERSAAAYHSRIRCWKPTSRQCSDNVELARECLHLRPVLTVADEHEHGVDAVVPNRAQCPHEVERPFDRGQSPRPSDRERVVGEPELAPQATPRLFVREPHSGRSNPYGTTVKRSAGATP